MTRTQMANQYMKSCNTNTSYSIERAANEWIAQIEDPKVDATPEQKTAMISRIREALPKVKVTGAENFVMACNAIKTMMAR